MEECPKKNKNIIYIDSFPKKIVYNKNNAHEYYLGDKEAAVFNMLDGTNNINLIAENSNLSKDSLKKLIEYFYQEGLLECEVKNKKDIFRIRLFRKYLSPNFFKRTTALFIQKLILFSFFVSIFIIGLIGYSSIKNQSFNINSINENMFSLQTVLVILMSFFFSVLFHELNHAITSVANGAYAVETGFMLQWFLPCVYVSVCGIKNITDKSKIIKILSSGCAANVILIGIAFLKCYLLDGFSKNDFIFIIVNISIIAMNCIIFLRNDSSQLLNIILNENRDRNILYSIKNSKDVRLENKVLNFFNLIVIIIGIISIILIKTFDHNMYGIKVLLPKLIVIILFNFLEVISFSLKRPFDTAVKYFKIYSNIIRICIIIIPLLIRKLTVIQFAAVVFISFVFSDFIYTIDVIISYYITRNKKN